MVLVQTEREFAGCKLKEFAGCKLGEFALKIEHMADKRLPLVMHAGTRTKRTLQTKCSLHSNTYNIAK